MVTAAEALFCESEPGVFIRKLTGNEALCSLVSLGRGFTHVTFSTNVKLLEPVSRDNLRQKVTHAMIRLRHLLPAIGCTISVLYPKQEFQFRYEVPKSLDDAVKWAGSVITLHEEPLSFEVANDRIAQTVWWKASDDRYTHELHLHPDPTDAQRWTFTLSAHHANADGRSTLMAFEKIFIFLRDELLGQVIPLEELKWSEETCRLSAPPELIPSIAKNGIPDEFLPIPDDFMPTPPDGYVPFLCPYKVADGVEDEVVSVRLDLTKEETTHFHEACKANGRTVTQVASALTALTSVEWILKVAAEKSDLYEETVNVFENSNFYHTRTNSVDARVLLPEGYNSLDAKHSTPLNCADGFSLSFPFEPYKKLVSVDKELFTISHIGDKNVFWNDLVRDVADAWSKEARTIDAFGSRAAVLTKMATDPTVDLSRIPSQAPIFSSCGNLTRLNILEQFRPSAGNKTLVVEDLDHSVRMPTPALSYSFLEYDGVFRFIICTGKQFWTKEQLILFTTLFKGWLDDVLS